MPVFRAGVAIVRVDAQVVEGNRIVGDLSKEDFEVFDEGAPQKIEYFARESEPLWLLLMLDLSGSMRRYLEPMAATAKTALGYLTPADNVAVTVFGRDSRVWQEFTDDRDHVAHDLAAAVRDQSAGLTTDTNTALLNAAGYIREHAKNGRHAILIVTDNQSMSYKVPNDSVLQALYGADTVLNAIVVGKGYRPPPPRAGMTANPDFEPSDVFAFAEKTGGEAVKAEKADAAFRDMLERIRTRYSLHYPAPESQPGVFRRIRVVLTHDAQKRHPHAKIRARAGYYTSAG